MYDLQFRRANETYEKPLHVAEVEKHQVSVAIAKKTLSSCSTRRRQVLLGLGLFINVVVERILIVERQHDDKQFTLSGWSPTRKRSHLQWPPTTSPGWSPPHRPPLRRHRPQQVRFGSLPTSLSRPKTSPPTCPWSPHGKRGSSLRPLISMLILWRLIRAHPTIPRPGFPNLLEICQENVYPFEKGKQKILTLVDLRICELGQKLSFLYVMRTYFLFASIYFYLECTLLAK